MKKPTDKVTATGTAGSAAVVLVWVLAQFDVTMPAVVAVATAALVMTAAGYIKRETRQPPPPGGGEHRAR